MPVCDWEKTITCPYNPSHQITQERIQWHLVKCRKSHPQSENIICPYNASHHVPKVEEQFHISTCPDRKIVEMSKYSWALERPNQHGNLSIPPSSVSNQYMEEEEDWEKEATIKTSYNPAKKASESNVLRKLEGATPSQRKEFRAKERVRLLQKQTEIQSTLNTKDDENNVFNYMTMTKEIDSQPLRRPTLPGNVNSNVSALLAAHMGRGGPGPISQMRRPGGLAMTDTTRESVNTSTDTIDTSMGLLTLGRGLPGTAGKSAPLRRPGLLGRL